MGAMLILINFTEVRGIWIDRYIHVYIKWKREERERERERERENKRKRGDREKKLGRERKGRRIVTVPKTRNEIHIISNVIKIL